MSQSAAPMARSIYCQGGLLTEGLLDRMRGLLESDDVGLPLERLGLRAGDYDPSAGDTLREQALRAWQRLLRAWASLKESRDKAEELALALTQQRWLRPLFEELGFGPPQPTISGGFVIGGRRYPVSHVYGVHIPIHLLPWGAELERRTRALKGAARSTPHSMLQEFLNRSPDHLWGLLCNGGTLRLLRDNDSLTQLAYVEFDLERMFEDERWPDFFSMWLTCHRSRFEPTQQARPDTCLIERWMEQSRSEGVLALDSLHSSVLAALKRLSAGFERGTPGLRDRLRADAMHEQLLRVVYRLMFLCVTEERDALLLPALGDQEPREAQLARQKARERYERHYSLRALRRDAASGAAREENPHGDLWLRLLAVARGLSRGHEALALPAINSFLWSSEAALPELHAASCRNDDLLQALWHLDHFEYKPARGPARTERINWRDISAAELGSVYEALLELHPRWSEAGEGLDYGDGAGSERKTTGSYYTPVELVEALLDSALNPLLERVLLLPRERREAALLALKVCDPSCGSGHFLVAAARRIGHELASLRSGEEAPSPEVMRVAVRDVVSSCIYGVDLNKLAVELCKVALWMEAMVPGLPLPYLEHHIQHGNALMGATPALLAAPLPDDAIAALEGDDGKVTNTLRASHRKQVAAAAQVTLSQWARGMVEALTTQAGQIEALSDQTLESLDAKDEAWRRYQESVEYTRARRHADLWCAAFVWRRTATSLPSPTHETLQQDPLALPGAMRKEVERLRDRYGFFHWHLQFPQVFHPAGGAGGFDLIVGNPPWETVELKDNEFFAKFDTQEAQAIVAAKKSADTKDLIEELTATDPELFSKYQDEKRIVDGSRHFMSVSGRYPLNGVGRINTYAVFAEHIRDSISTKGRAGFIVPSGIATDDNTKAYFQAITESRQLAAVFHFENEDKLFPAVTNRVNFCIVSLGGREAGIMEADFACYMRRADEIHNPNKRYKLSAEDIRAINPNTGTLPAFRWARDAQLTSKIHRRIPILWGEGERGQNVWGLRLKQGLFNMASDSGLFMDQDKLKAEGWTQRGNIWERGEERALPLWEGKMVHIFDHRFGTYEGQTEAQANKGILPRTTPEQKANARFVTQPQYWVERHEIMEELPEEHASEWLIGWRKTCRSTDERTLIPSVIPMHAANDKFQLIFLPPEHRRHAAAFLANLSSLVCDYSVRQRLGGADLSFYILKQTPLLPPVIYDQPCPWTLDQTIGAWVTKRAIELAYTSEELRSFARDCGIDKAPFVWGNNRQQLRAELDAAFFGLYGLNKEQVSEILESFNLIDESYKQLVKESYRELMQQAGLVRAANKFAEEIKQIKKPETSGETNWPLLILGGLALGAGIAYAVDVIEEHRAKEAAAKLEDERQREAALRRMYEVIGRIVTFGFPSPKVEGLKAAWRIGGWEVSVDWSGSDKARAKASNEEQEEERGRAFALDAADLADQIVAFLRGLS